MGTRKFKWDTFNKSRRCGHPWCDQCRTKRGHNRGNRRARKKAKTLLKKVVKYGESE